MRKEQNFSQMPGARLKQPRPQEGVAGLGRAACGRITGAPDHGLRRHAQVRRATYTYGVVPQDVQLLHQLCDLDVLETRDTGEVSASRVGRE